MKYVLVTGGVVSGLGKGVTASSIGVVLKACGLRVTSIKIDPYLNTDAGTMSPFEHGEVFVLDDGGEVDLDLGNYERFLDVTLTKDNNITTGKIYQSVLEKERKGDYLGRTVQVVPHVTDAIKDWIESVSLIPVDGKEGQADVCVIELGGTVGDIESMPFIEALRQLSFSVGVEATKFTVCKRSVTRQGFCSNPPNCNGLKLEGKIHFNCRCRDNNVESRLNGRKTSHPIPSLPHDKRNHSCMCQHDC